MTGVRNRPEGSGPGNWLEGSALHRDMASWKREGLPFEIFRYLW